MKTIRGQNYINMMSLLRSFEASLHLYQPLGVGIEFTLVVLEGDAQIRNVDPLGLALLDALVLVRAYLDLPQHLGRQILRVTKLRRFPALRHPILAVTKRILVALR